MDFKLSDRAPAALSSCPRVVHLLSMVFEGCRPESPEANVLARERPCLEHMQRCSGLLVVFSLSLVFV